MQPDLLLLERAVANGWAGSMDAIMVLGMDALANEWGLVAWTLAWIWAWMHSPLGWQHGRCHGWGMDALAPNQVISTEAEFKL